MSHQLSKNMIRLTVSLLAFLLLAGCAREAATAEETVSQETAAAQGETGAEILPSSEEIIIEVDDGEDVGAIKAAPEDMTPAGTESASETGSGEASGTAAETNAPDTSLLYAISSVNVRKAPSTEAQAAGKLAAGESVEFIEQTDEEWTKVLYKGEPCYIASAFLTDDEESVDGSLYSYERMEKKLKQLAARNQQLMELSSIAVTADGRNVYCLRVGPETAEKKVLITASIHAREYITTELLMGLMTDYIDAIAGDRTYGTIRYRDLADRCAVYFVPMVNPDGVTISQYGPDGLNKPEVKAQVEAIARSEGGGSESYYRHWKSNAEGIDLNRQFDARWEEYNDHVGKPSADHYKGTAPGTTAEAKGLIGLTEKVGFARTVSYHTAGSVIYWYFGQEGQLLQDTKAFADRMSGLTGYPTDANFESLDPAGYKDWAIIKKGIPSLTIEVGNGDSPLDHDQLGSIRNRNKNVIEETCLSALGL